jgi:hypothetical protein
MKTTFSIQYTNSRNWTIQYVGYKLDLEKEEIQYIAHELGYKSFSQMLKAFFNKVPGFKTFQIDYTHPIKDIVVRHMMKFARLPF